MYDIIAVLVLLIIGYSFGSVLEKKHFRSLNKRERALVNLPTTTRKKPVIPLPDPASGQWAHAKLVTGSCVISIDYFKRFVAGLRKIFGGHVVTYEGLVDRARREAILRLKEQAKNAQQLVNLRIETSSVSQGRQNQLGSVEVLAYATAIYVVTNEVHTKTAFEQR